MPERYDEIGIDYRTRRKPDPRIAELIVRELDECRTVLNVGAGTGSYEPMDREVIAVEPSLTMIRQRPEGAAPVVRAFAEALPFPDARTVLLSSAKTECLHRNFQGGVTSTEF